MNSDVLALVDRYAAGMKNLQTHPWMENSLRSKIEVEGRFREAAKTLGRLDDFIHGAVNLGGPTANVCFFWVLFVYPNDLMCTISIPKRHTGRERRLLMEGAHPASYWYSPLWPGVVLGSTLPDRLSSFSLA